MIRAAGAVTLLAALAGPGHAAEITVLQPGVLDLAELEAGACSLSLRGPIAAGDAAAIEALFETDQLRGFRSLTLTVTDRGEGPRGHALCLDSRGGSYSEGIALARFLIDRGIATSVPEGAECLSACAVAFMGGTLSSMDSGGGARMPYRVLHPGGQLGFHAPYVDFGKMGATIRPAVAEAAFRTALSTMRMITEGLEGGDSYVPTERFHKRLLLGMLDNYGPERFHMIETVEQAGLYDIRLAGPPKVAVEGEGWLRLCSNMLGWARGGHVPTDPPVSSWSHVLTLAGAAPDPEVPRPRDLIMIEEEVPAPWDFTAQVSSRHQACTFYAHPLAEDVAEDVGGGGAEFSAYFATTADHQSLRFRPAWGWQSLPYYTRIDALAGGNRQVDDIRYGRTGAPTLQDPVPMVEKPLPGWSLVMRALEPGPNEAIHFGRDGMARVLRGGAEVETLPYRLQGTGACFQPEGAAEFCAEVVVDEDGDRYWQGAEPQLIEFMRPGDATRLP